MVKRIQCFLTDAEASELEKAKEKLEVTSDYAFVKLAISELCIKANGNGTVSEAEGVKRTSPSPLETYVKKAKYVCANCSFPIVNVEKIKSCPACGETKVRKLD